MRKILMVLKNNRGTSGIVVILGCFLIGLATIMLLEIYRYYTVKDSIDKELSRAVNIAIDMSMDDEKRKLHMSSLKTDDAIQEFYSYLQDELGLDEELKYNADNLKYQLVLNNVKVQSDPPEFEVQGTVFLKPEYISDLVPYQIEIPVKAKARNQRMDED